MTQIYQNPKRLSSKEESEVPEVPEVDYENLEDYGDYPKTKRLSSKERHLLQNNQKQGNWLNNISEHFYEAPKNNTISNQEKKINEMKHLIDITQKDIVTLNKKLESISNNRFKKIINHRNIVDLNKKIKELENVIHEMNRLIKEEKKVSRTSESMIKRKKSKYKKPKKISKKRQ